MTENIVLPVFCILCCVLFVGWVVDLFRKKPPEGPTEGDIIKDAKVFLAIPRQHIDGSWYYYKVTLVPCEEPATQGKAATIVDPIQRRAQ